MLFKQRFWAGIADGTITVAFRRWHRPTVRGGGSLRTPVGVIAISSVAVTNEDAISPEDLARAGYVARDELLEELGRADGGQLYRIEWRFAGADPRVALREQASLTDDDLSAIRQRLARLDAASRGGPWTEAVLALIQTRPGVLAARLAATLGQDTAAFKRNVRKLKELGLTESLDVGYRLSPRGTALMRRG